MTIWATATSSYPELSPPCRNPSSDAAVALSACSSSAVDATATHSALARPGSIGNEINAGPLGEESPLAGLDRLEQVHRDVGYADLVIVLAGALHPVVQHDVAEGACRGDPAGSGADGLLGTLV